MKTIDLKTLSIAVAAVLMLSVSAQAQEKVSKMKKDTTKMAKTSKVSKMDHKKDPKKMDKASKMKKEAGKME